MLWWQCLPVRRSISLKAKPTWNQLINYFPFSIQNPTDTITCIDSSVRLHCVHQFMVDKEWLVGFEQRRVDKYRPDNRENPYCVQENFACTLLLRWQFLTGTTTRTKHTLSRPTTCHFTHRPFWREASSFCGAFQLNFSNWTFDFCLPSSTPSRAWLSVLPDALETLIDSSLLRCVCKIPDSALVVCTATVPSSPQHGAHWTAKLLHFRLFCNFGRMMNWEINSYEVSFVRHTINYGCTFDCKYNKSNHKIKSVFQLSLKQKSGNYKLK